MFAMRPTSTQLSRDTCEEEELQVLVVRAMHYIFGKMNKKRTALKGEGFASVTMQRGELFQASRM